MISDEFDKNYKVNVSHATMDYLFQSIRAGDKEIERLNNVINKAIKYIKEHCIDDEFYINLSDKEKGIVGVLTILQKGSDEISK